MDYGYIRSYQFSISGPIQFQYNVYPVLRGIFSTLPFFNFFSRFFSPPPFLCFTPPDPNFFLFTLALNPFQKSVFHFSSTDFRSTIKNTFETEDDIYKNSPIKENENQFTLPSPVSPFHIFHICSF